MKKTLNVWMQLLGFEKDDPDRGVARLLNTMDYVPDSICALLFHPDFVHLHGGMEKEVQLFPDNCAYRGIVQNKERRRQKWTNYDLRTLIAELKKKDIDFYIGIMGAYARNQFHHEWLSDHPEARAFELERDGGLACLKRLADGSYYEDFFIEMLVKTLQDYDCAGVHLSDEFCPMTHLYRGDWSADMTEQFLEYTGFFLPENVMITMEDDSLEARRVRHAYIWKHLREDWIRFYEWRWERFFKKVCDAVHAIGKKVWILGMYCTDPFETRYIYGFDSRRVMEAGVDCITANILPSSVTYEMPEFPYYFHRMHMILPLLRAQVGEKNIISMVGVQDATEEWSILEHHPMRLERDIYTTSSMVTRFGGEYRRATDGLFFCLGDGISSEGWKVLKKDSDIGFGEEIEHSWSPMLLWSDYQNDVMLKEYIHTRRSSAHKQSFEIVKAGTPFGGAIRSDELGEFNGVLFVPNYDLLTTEEQELLKNASYPWVGTVPANAEISAYGVCSTYEFADCHGEPGMKAFLCGHTLTQEEKAEISRLLVEDDGVRSRRNEPERMIHPLVEELPFGKLSQGFVASCGVLLRSAMKKYFPIAATRPMMALRLKNGKDRIYLYNPYDSGYCQVAVTFEKDICSAEIISSYPVQPVRFLEEGHSGVYYDFQKEPKTKKRFVVKLAPDGVTIVDVKR